MSPRLRILIADDRPIVREGLKYIIGQAPDLRVAGEAAEGGELLSRLRRGGFELLLLGSGLPALGGDDMIHRLRSHHAGLPILVLGKTGEAQTARRALKGGASGYIADNCDGEALLQAIRRLAAGGRYIDPALAEQIAFEESLGAGAGERHRKLSGREFQVLRLLAGGLTVNAIAAKLAISNRTVSTHKARLMEKMGFASTAELVRYAVEHRLID